MSLPTTPPRVMRGATLSTDGAAGYTPKPIAGQENLYLRGDGTYATPGSAGSVSWASFPQTIPVGSTISAGYNALLVGTVTNPGDLTIPSGSTLVIL